MRPEPGIAESPMKPSLTVMIDKLPAIHIRLISGVFWTLVVAMVSQGCTLLSSVIAARLLGCEDYGKLAMMLSLVASLANLAGMGLGLTAVKFLSEVRGHATERTGRILGVCSVTTTVTGLMYAGGLILAAPWIAREFLRAPELVNEIRLLSVAVLFMTMNGYQVGALQGLETFSTLARAASIMGPITVALTLGLTWTLRLPGPRWSRAPWPYSPGPCTSSCFAARLGATAFASATIT